MNKALDLKSILLFHLCYQIRNSGSTYYDSNDQHLDSQSQENDSDMDEREEHQHFRRSNQNQNYDYQKDSTILSYSYNYDECNSCACNKCSNPPDCCKEVCRSCPKPSSQMSQFQMISMPQIQQLPFPVSPESPISMPQILQMPMGQISLSRLQMPSMQMPPMQMPEMQMPQMQFLGQIPNQNLVYIPLSSSLMSFLRNHSQSEPPGTKELHINKTSTTTTAATTTSTTTVATTTPTNSTTTPLPLRTTTLIQNLKQRSKLYLQPQIENKNMLELAIKNVLKAFSNNMMKTAQKSNSHYDKYVLASALRRTKPVISNIDTSRYGIVPAEDDTTQSLMLEMRDAKDIRDSA